jgi:hypothetical protein
MFWQGPFRQEPWEMQMNAQAYLFAATLALVPVSASAQNADCSADLNRVTSQLESMSKTVASHAKIGVSAAVSGYAITANRMATASTNAASATLSPTDHAPSGAEGMLPQTAAAQTGGGGADRAIILARAQSAWQAALADHVRGNEAGCAREIADARNELNSIKG